MDVFERLPFPIDTNASILISRSIGGNNLEDFIMELLILTVALGRFIREFNNKHFENERGPL